MIVLAACLLVILIIEFILFFKLTNNIKISYLLIKKIPRKLFNIKISDLLKEKILKKYSFLLFVNSLIILISISFFIILFFLLDYFINGFLYSLINLTFSSLLTIFALFYYYIRNKLIFKFFKSF